jgi:hypothetical protein
MKNCLMEMNNLPDWIQELWKEDSSMARKAEAQYKELEETKALLSDARNYIIDTAEFGIDHETLQARAEQYKNINK